MSRYPAMPNFPKPKIDNVRPTLAPTQANFIAGDPQGLFWLATAMYDYVRTQSDPTVTTLVKTVTKLVHDDNQPGGYTPGKDGGWVGDTARVFRDTFISDAAMMNGLNSVICSVAKTADDLAVGLSSLESKLELALEKNAANIEGFNLDWLVTVGSGTNPTFKFTRLALPGLQKYLQKEGARRLLDSCNRIGDPFFVQADKLRHTAGSQLVAVGQVLEEAFGYYADHSASRGSPDTSDPSILLTSDQNSSNQTAVKNLEGKYSQLAAKLNNTSMDRNAAKKVLDDLGIAADKSNTIIDGIKDIKDAKSAVERGSKFLSLIGKAVPVLMMIGMAG